MSIFVLGSVFQFPRPISRSCEGISLTLHLGRLGYREFILAGDLNLDWGSAEAEPLVGMCEADVCDLVQLSNQPTRLRNGNFSDRNIDHLYVSSTISVSNFGYLPPLADHLMLAADLSLGSPPQLPPRRTLLWKDADWAEANNLLFSAQLERTVGSAPDVNTAWFDWHRIITNVIKEVVPPGVQKERRYEPPWYSRALRNLHRLRDNLFRKWVRDKTVQNRRKYNRVRNRLKKGWLGRIIMRMCLPPNRHASFGGQSNANGGRFPTKFHP